MSIRLVGLDLSLTGTGVAWNVNHRGERGVGCQTVHTGTRRGHERLDLIRIAISAACGMRPHLVVIEEAFHGEGKAAVSMPLAGLHGIVTHWLWSNALPYVYVHPSHVKMWATGKGSNVTKREVMEAVVATYGRLCSIEDDNAADAMSLLSLGLAAYGEPLVEVLNPNNRRALEAVRWPDLNSPTGRAAVPTAAGRGTKERTR